MKKKWLPVLAVSLVVIGLGGIPASGVAVAEGVAKVGPVKLNPHPANLKGKRVLLRWNGKYYGDKFLIRVGELFTQHVKTVKIIKMWEVDTSTASVSDSLEESEEIAAKIAKQRPDIVIAAHVG